MFNKMFQVPLEILALPRNGECLVDYYWMVSTGGAMFYYRGKEPPAPQANRMRNVADFLLERMPSVYAGCSVIQIPIAYLAQALEFTKAKEHEYETYKRAQRATVGHTRRG